MRNAERPCFCSASVRCTLETLWNLLYELLIEHEGSYIVYILFKSIMYNERKRMWTELAKILFWNLLIQVKTIYCETSKYLYKDIDIPCVQNNNVTSKFQ